MEPADKPRTDSPAAPAHAHSHPHSHIGTVALRLLRALVIFAAALIIYVLWAQKTFAASPPPKAPPAGAEVRGTWVTTTANTAISTPANTAATMRRLREIGLNTVYVETWKNGYTQYPSKVLERTIGVDRRPALMKSDPSDTPEQVKYPGRDLLRETLIEAHRNGLTYIAWFEYGFMAAHKDARSQLSKMKPEWLSRDIKGNEVAPNGFVWMNPLHPEARQFLLDLVCEAIDNYDLDGIQLDDRIVWPYYTMGYDDYTKQAYAKEHNGAMPPEDPKDPEWRRWRVEKVNEYSKIFVEEVRKRRPGIIVSLSPAPYPWCYEYYLLEWPKWAQWMPNNDEGRWWDEFIPQCYRMNYDAFAKTWLDQVKQMNELGAGRVSDLLAGIRVVGDGPDSTWPDLKKAIELTRESKSGGHVLWFSRGVLDLYPSQLTEFYNAAQAGAAPHPKFGPNWRPPSIALTKGEVDANATKVEGRESRWWSLKNLPAGNYQVIAKKNGEWVYAGKASYEFDRPTAQARSLTGEINDILREGSSMGEEIKLRVDSAYDAVELLVDRRELLSHARKLPGY